MADTMIFGGESFNMRIGFSKSDITPPLGTELGGYAGYRPCSGVHDLLWCKAAVLEQDGTLYALLALDLLCADEGLYLKIAEKVSFLGIVREKLIVSAIHSHAAPVGVLPGEGPLAAVNRSIEPENPAFLDYMQAVVEAAVSACAAAAANLDYFVVRTARGPLPQVGTERHTGEIPKGELTALQFRTERGKNLIFYNFPCHPTVLSAENLQVSADFVGSMEPLLDADMAMFVNGAAGDISTRFTRREATFAECRRMGSMAAEQIKALLEAAPFRVPEPIRGIHTRITLQVRQVEPLEKAQKRLEELTAQWKAAETAGAAAREIRILKSYAEGAGVSLQFSQTMGGIRKLELPVTVFRFAGLRFVSVPGELFSVLRPPQTVILGYANGYYRYIAHRGAYDAGYYEAMAAIVEKGSGERLKEEIERLLAQLDY